MSARAALMRRELRRSVARQERRSPLKTAIVVANLRGWRCFAKWDMIMILVIFKAEEKEHLRGREWCFLFLDIFG